MKKPVAILALVIAGLVVVTRSPSYAADQSAERGSTSAGRYIRTPAPVANGEQEPSVERDHPDYVRWDAPECRWVGHRIVMALLRDDVLAADGFQRFYRDFGCPVSYLGQVFGCAVPFAGEAVPLLQQHAALCWQDAGYTESAMGDADGTAAAEITSKPPTGKAKVPPAAAAAAKRPIGEPEKAGTTYPKR